MDAQFRDGMITVQLPSGATFPVHTDEVDYFEERVDLYMSQNHFVNISDKQDVDRMLILELLVYRWGVWLSQQFDYWGEAVDPQDMHKRIKEMSGETRQLKKLLGIDKVTRDKQKGDDSVAAFIENLLHRGREFGVTRERQLDKAMELFNQMRALVTLYDNSDEIERREMHVTPEDVIEWLRDVAIPEYQEIDDYFRTHAQRLWVRSM